MLFGEICNHRMETGSQNRVAIVAASSKEIGRATALALALALALAAEGTKLALCAMAIYSTRSQRKHETCTASKSIPIPLTLQKMIAWANSSRLLPPASRPSLLRCSLAPETAVRHLVAHVPQILESRSVDECRFECGASPRRISCHALHARQI
jgi:NAD(P)-dependent dehydrogenase (short-subunit alcohol dehydrogenase family)